MTCVFQDTNHKILYVHQGTIARIQVSLYSPCSNTVHSVSEKFGPTPVFKTEWQNLTWGYDPVSVLSDPRVTLIIRVYSVLNRVIVRRRHLSYLVDRYATILTKYDVQTLFERLQASYGNRRRATSKLGIQRKTVYDWDKTANDVRTLTKRKVLEASLEVDPDWTIAFLVKKTSEDFKEILQRQITLAYTKTMRSKNKKGFQGNLSTFNRIREIHRGALLDSDLRAQDRMIKRINEKADLLGVPGVIPSTRTIPPENLAQRVTELIDILRQKRLSETEIKRSFDLPPILIDSICRAYAYIEPVSSEVSIADYHGPPIVPPASLRIEGSHLALSELLYEGTSTSRSPHLLGAKYK
jgi:hypothetical protein